MASFRTIDSGLFRHPAFRRADLIAREVFVYLFSCAADDEGRFSADVEAILDGAFSRKHEADEAAIIAALAYWEDAGWLVLYGDRDQYGFLCGWFEHQYIQKSRRSPSTLPAPAVAVNSWAIADAMREQCSEALERPLQQTTYQDTLRWVTGRQRDADGALTERQPSVNGSLTQRYPEVEVEVEVEGKRKNIKGNDITPPADADDVMPATEPPIDPDPAPPPTRKPREETPEQQAIHRLWDAFELPGGPTPPKGAKPGYSAVLKQLKENGIPLFDDLAAHVASDPTARLPLGAEPWGWFCKQVRSYLGAIWKWKPDGADRPSSNGKLFVTCSDGSKLWEDSPNWGLSQELGVAEAKAEGIWNQRTGCTTVPSRGFCCDDGWYYDSRDDGSMYQARRWGQ